MDNPVAWQMWGPEAIALAKKHNRLLFVSIGYAACHCKLPASWLNTSVDDVVELLTARRVSRHGARVLPL